MTRMCQEYRKDDLLISTDKRVLDPRIIQQALKNIYWGDYVPSDVVRLAISNSLCFGMYREGQHVGFARVVTDFSTVAYIVDLFLIEAYDTPALKEWMLDCILAYPRLAPVRKWLIASKHGIYGQYHFLTVTPSGTHAPSAQ